VTRGKSTNVCQAMNTENLTEDTHLSTRKTMEYKMSLRALIVTPLNGDFKNEFSALTSFDQNEPWLLHEESGVRVVTKKMLIWEFGCQNYIQLRFDNCNKCLQTTLSDA
jgi:hypothetical protein